MFPDLVGSSAFRPRGWVDEPAVSIENRRLEIDGDHALSEVAAQFARAFGYTAKLELDPTLSQLLRVRVSQINNCTYCMELHYRIAREIGIPQGKIDTLTAWWETDLFSSAEQAALAYTEALTRVADTTVADRFEPYHQELVAHFSESEIVEIVAVVVNMNVWTRLKLAVGATPTVGDS